MPIRAEMKSRYPADWPEIARRIIKDRAGDKCEGCGAENGQPHPVSGFKVVLACAHRDHTPENCDDANLVAFCQRCHLRYDRHHHRACERTSDLFQDHT